MQGVHHLLKAMEREQSTPGGAAAGMMLGQIVRVIRREDERIVTLSANGLRIEMEDLGFAPGLLNELEENHTVLVFSPDAQLYYIICRVVKP